MSEPNNRIGCAARGSQQYCCQNREFTNTPAVKGKQLQDLANFIGGAWVPAHDGATDEVLDPATGAVIATAPASGEADVDAAVAAARGAFGEWSAKTPRQRSEALHAVADAIEANMDELRALECANVGKPVSIIEFEMDLTLDNWRFFASAGRFLEGKAAGEYEAGYTSMIRRDPLGVIGSIAPWN
ncbi:MAG: aldehyde dehydrogenase family protein, partial [Acidimicrobiales bacterium]|nr:aldehyde dehydrogenase family protein [Acidimicrobiales bacterium]